MIPKSSWSIRLLLCTGMRRQEMLALEPRHIAKDGSTITIEQVLVRVKGSVDIGTPKSQDSHRTIPVPENVQYCARLLRDTSNKFIWESPKNPGIPCNPSHFSNLFKEAVESVEGVRKEAVDRFSEAFSKIGRGTFGNVLDYKKSS